MSHYYWQWHVTVDKTSVLVQIFFCKGVRGGNFIKLFANLGQDISQEAFWEEDGRLGGHFESQFSLWCASSYNF